ncbi:MAG: ROK family protein [Pseudomonadota bacterium]
MLIGIDWGGTKIEIIALSPSGDTLLRRRATTPRNDYHACIETVRDLVNAAELETGQTGTVGLGIPGAISPATGLVKNANSVWLNGKPLKRDLEQAIGRTVRIENDANCFAVSEAQDGAAEGADVVVGVIIGTGCGSGIALSGRALTGRHAIAGEFGHTPLPFMTAEEYPGNACWCGRRGCLETYISGTGFQRDYETRLGFPSASSVQDILEGGGDIAAACYEAYVDRLARGLSTLINLIDPDMIVLGGGMSNIEALYNDVPQKLGAYVFSDRCDTPIVKARHGDSSGVRGAAFLWAGDTNPPVKTGKREAR